MSDTFCPWPACKCTAKKQCRATPITFASALPVMSDTIEVLEAALAKERARAEKAEAERDAAVKKLENWEAYLKETSAAVLVMNYITVKVVGNE